MRPAFTLVELLVAIVVFTIGLLALAATAGVVAGHVGDGARLTSSAHLVRSILDSLAARDCSAIVAGTATRNATTIAWTPERDSAATSVDVRVGTLLRRGVKQDSYLLLVPCTRP